MPVGIIVVDLHESTSIFLSRFGFRLVFPMSEAGAALGLIRGGKPVGGDLLVLACLGSFGGGAGLVGGLVLGAAGGRVTLSRALFKAKRCSSCHVPLHLHP